MVSGLPVAAAVSGVPTRGAPSHIRLFKWLIFAPLSISLSPIIAPLSSLDDYAIAKTISKRIWALRLEKWSRRVKLRSVSILRIFI